MAGAGWRWVHGLAIPILVKLQTYSLQLSKEQDTFTDIFFIRLALIQISLFVDPSGCF